MDSAGVRQGMTRKDKEMGRRAAGRAPAVSSGRGPDPLGTLSPLPAERNLCTQSESVHVVPAGGSHPQKPLVGV